MLYTAILKVCHHDHGGYSRYVVMRGSTIFLRVPGPLDALLEDLCPVGPS